MSDRVLVTGARGFIAQHLIRALDKRGRSVRVLTRAPDPALFPKTVDVRGYDGLTDRAGIRRAAAGVNAVVHLAGVAHEFDRRKASSTMFFEQANVDGTRNLLEEVMDAGVKFFLFMSSIAAASDERGTEPRNGLTPYGWSKRAAESLVLAAASDAFRPIVLRPPGVYGSGMKGNLLKLFSAIARGYPIPVSKRPNARSFISVRNLVEAIVHLEQRSDVAARIFPVADIEVWSTEELVRFISQEMGKRVRTFRVPNPLAKTVGWLGDAFRLPVDSGRVNTLLGSLVVSTDDLARATGFVPPFSGPDEMSRAVHWYVKSTGPARP